MCECGCTMNDVRYRLPAPNGAIYLITLRGHCTNCDGGSVVLVELVEPSHSMFKEYTTDDEWATDGELPLEQWPYTKGAIIETGMVQSDFVKAMIPYLENVGTDMIDEGSGTIGKDGAEVIAEEMYDDMQFKPTLFQPPAKTSKTKKRRRKS